jgi:hypothetical protein
MTARAERRSASEDFARTRISLGLWFGFLGGPSAAFLNVLVGYPAVDRACVSDSSVILHVLTLLFLAMAAVATIVAWRLRGRLPRERDIDAGLLPRSRFLATVGILTGALSFVAIIMQWIPVFVLGACHGT